MLQPRGLPGPADIPDARDGCHGRIRASFLTNVHNVFVCGRDIDKLLGQNNRNDQYNACSRGRGKMSAVPVYGREAREL